MTAGTVANSIVNICGAIGLAVAMTTLYRRDPKDPLTARFLAAMGLVALLFLMRGVAWLADITWLDRLSLIPAGFFDWRGIAWSPKGCCGVMPLAGQRLPSGASAPGSGSTTHSESTSSPRHTR